jgi:hypothetical protein
MFVRSNNIDLCREVKETTKQVTQEWVGGQQTRYREFQQKLLSTGRSHGTKQRTTGSKLKVFSARV